MNSDTSTEDSVIRLVIRLETRLGKLWEERDVLYKAVSAGLNVIYEFEDSPYVLSRVKEILCAAIAKVEGEKR